MRSTVRPAWRRAGAFALAGLGALILSACAETEFLVHTAKGVSTDTGRPGVRPPTAGSYKIGKPYQIGGTWYYPAEDFNYSETGIASWYGPGFHGKSTANGERYDQNALTAAHRTLPLPTVVRVTNLENGRAIVVRINDRGPFSRGRIIDMSRRGAQLLGFENNGTAKVRVDVLAEESQQLKLAALNSGAAKLDQVQVAASPRDTVEASALPPAPGRNSAQPQRVPVDTAGRSSQPLPEAQAPVLPTDVEVLPVSPTGIYVQAGAFSDLTNALRMRDRLFDMGPTQISRFQVSGAELYRVRIGPLANVDTADATLARLLDSGVQEARLVVE